MKASISIQFEASPLSLTMITGIIVAVREYLNKASWRVTPKGVCRVVQKSLDSQSAPATMQVEAILTNGPSAAVADGISFSTARRWLARLGWIWGRDRKGY